MRSSRTAFDCTCLDCRNGPTQGWLLSTEKEDSQAHLAFDSSEERLLLCPPKILGYVLTKKIWGQFRVENVHLIDSSHSSSLLFDTKLELGEDYNVLLKACLSNIPLVRNLVYHVSFCQGIH